MLMAQSLGLGFPQHSKRESKAKKFKKRVWFLDFFAFDGFDVFNA
jgi:hypothetical protein